MPHSSFMSVSFNTISTRGRIAIGCIFIFAISCARKVPPVNVPERLKTVWLSYLKRQPNYDSTRVRFEVKDVYFFADTASYICQFKVRMQVPSRNVDTVGMMDGTVSKDFTIVHRKD
jgi:hypothetical protein